MKMRRDTAERKADALQRKFLGKVGEEIAESLLAEKGFHVICNLNSFHKNFPFADILAEKGGTRYVISVKARQFFDKDGKTENTDCHLLYGGKREKAQMLEIICHAKAHWLVIQFVRQDERTVKYSAYFGSVRELEDAGKNIVSIPDCRAGKIGQPFAKNRNLPQKFVKKFQDSDFRWNEI